MLTKLSGNSSLLAELEQTGVDYSEVITSRDDKGQEKVSGLA